MRLKTNFFKIESNRDESIAVGKVLVSEPLLAEPCFQRSVVLLVEHEAKGGSMGLVLNKPLDMSFEDIFPDIVTNEDIPIYCGGPMETNKLYYLHTLGHIIPNSIQIADNLYIDGDFDAILSYIKSGNKVRNNIRFFLGYSGWDKNQLREELNQNVWAMASRFDFGHCFSPHDETTWKSAVESLGEPYKLWLRFPKEPYLN